MVSHTENHSGNFWKVLYQGSAVLVSLALASIIQYLLNPKSEWWEFYTQAKWSEIFATTLGGVAMYAILFIIVYTLSKWINSKSVLQHSMIVHFFITTGVVMVCMFLLLSLENLFYEKLWPQMNDNHPLEVDVRNYLVVNIVVAAFVNSIYNIFFFFQKWKIEVTETNKLNVLSHQLRENALQAELEVLKLQLDPHFLFNNFSVLTQLIETDTAGAKEFLSSLSKVYRYILTTSKKDIVRLDEELKFLETYFHLIKIRHGDKIHLTIEIENIDRKMGIPPVTLQLLIENAIKHNISTHDAPLFISISSLDRDQIIIKNNVQRINIDYKSTGMGLKNINERYQLLQGKSPLIIKSESSFEVLLPLLQV